MLLTFCAYKSQNDAYLSWASKAAGPGSLQEWGSRLGSQLCILN